MKYLPLLLLLTVAGCKTGKEDLPDTTTGLVLHLNFDENTTEQLSGTNGTAVNTVYGADHKQTPNHAVYFTRADSSYIDFGDLENASLESGVFTISCWIGTTDSIHVGAVFSKRGLTGPWEYSLDNHFAPGIYNFDNWIDNGGNSVYGIDPLKASAPIDPALWQHIVYVADGNQLKVYVNNVLQTGVDERNSGLNFTNTTAPFVVGNGGGYNKNYYFDGAVDDLRIYNRVLDESAISYLYWH